MSLIVEAGRLLESLVGFGGSFDDPCEGSRHHSPTPLRTFAVHLSAVVPECLGDSAPAPEDSPVWLCQTCDDNLRVFTCLMIAADGAMPWPMQREFGNTIRDLGIKAWSHYKGEPRA